MRILELISTLEQGGAEQIISTLALEFCARGHDVHLACVRDPGFMPIPKHRLEAAGVHFTAFNKQDGFSIKALRAICAYIRENQIQVVHSHNPPVTHYGAIAARLAGACAAVATIHGTATLSMPTWARALFWGSCFVNHQVVSVCHAVDEVMRRRFPLPHGRYATVYNGINLSSLLSIQRRPANGTMVFGTMARLVPVKDHQTLLHAFAQIWHSYPYCRLEILGDGELRSDLEGLAERLGLADVVTFHGWSSDIARFLSGIDVFVISSLSEGLPLTLLEAMAAGLAVVGTSVGGVLEVIQNADCGWLGAAGDPVSLATAMESAILAPDRLRRGARGRASVIQNHSLAAMATNYERVFSELLRARRTSKRTEGEYFITRAN